MAFFPKSKINISEKCMVTPNFLFGYQEHLPSSCFLCLVLNRAKNIPVFVGTTHRKPEYLEVLRTYAQ